MATINHRVPCTRTHQIAALALIVATFFFTRLFDQTLNQCSSQYPTYFSVANAPDDVVSWGYGPRLNLKIYVYGEDEIDGLKMLMYGREGKISAEACVKGQWGTQVKIHRLLLQSMFRTRRKEEADLFFVPSYVKCVRMMGGLNDKEINQTYVKVLSQMPYFRLSGGRNHIFVFPSGAGAHLFKSWATYMNRSIILTPEGDRTDKRPTSAFNTWKDIIIPGNVDDGRAQGKTGRLQLIELSKQYPDKLESPVLKFSGPDKLGRTDYFQHLRYAKFCLPHVGSHHGLFGFTSHSSWSVSLTLCSHECVPVILSDQVELPFQNVVDYTPISIKWPSNQIGPQLLDYLESIPDKNIEEMISKGRKIRCRGVLHSRIGAVLCFSGILWELQKKMRQFHQSVETFWLHNDL
ncbi:hypothetical protein BUALT_Bualt01G0014900 [Buddleja alternifolia]|uniref:Exostosin GT47 domain-containing protein n=1 Tax=Buddleja alternifolia TaxID=168488 RepID=A0AAV6Y5U6_9LAMI|nr:hypothetical protein BUALT_Bualt01G0014900 [Buddleja alternifolia]